MAINIYSKSPDEFGRRASNYAHTPFVHPRYGKFESVEGFWHYVRSGYRCEELKNLHGCDAKRVGKEQEYMPNHDFVHEITKATMLKVIYNKMAEELIETYPTSLVHNHVFNGVSIESTDDITSVIWTSIRTYLMNNFPHNPMVDLIESLTIEDEDIAMYADKLLTMIKSLP